MANNEKRDRFNLDYAAKRAGWALGHLERAAQHEKQGNLGLAEMDLAIALEVEGSADDYLAKAAKLEKGEEI